MSIKDKLQIILITYNREKYLKLTLDKIFEEKSPIKDFDVSVLDNCSPDNTENLCHEYSNKFPNFKYIKNKRNVGVSGNLIKAMDLVTKDYYWIICDDDDFDWTYWSEVEDAINDKQDIICICHNILSFADKDNEILKLIQTTSPTATIINSKYLNDTGIKNAYDYTFSLFPYVLPSIYAINDNKKIYLTEHPITIYNNHLEETDCSYNRGANNDYLMPKNKYMSWIVGFANICAGLKDKAFIYACMDTAINLPWTYGGWKNFYKTILNLYKRKEDWVHLMDLYVALPPDKARKLVFLFVLKNFNPIRLIKNYFKAKKEEKICE